MARTTRRKPAATDAVTKANKAPVATKSRARKAGTKAAAPRSGKKHTPAKAQKPGKTIRDSFNMPAVDYALIGELKKRALAAAREVKKSELLRAGLHTLKSLSDDAFKSLLASMPSIKTGRPRKKGK